MKRNPLTTAVLAPLALALLAPVVHAKPYASAQGQVLRNNYGECWRTINYKAEDQTNECGGDDRDRDGVLNEQDACPNTPGNTAVDARGCAVAIAEPKQRHMAPAKPYADNVEGQVVRNNYGECWRTINYKAVDQTIECGAPDHDKDGVPDLKDQCPGTPQGVQVGATGCPLEIDGDGDGVLDDQDACPNTPNGATVDARGCTVVVVQPTPTPVVRREAPRPDTDGDGVYDANDACPNTPVGHKVTPSGCSTIAVIVYFDTDQSDLSAAAMTKLREAATALGDKGIIQITASGYADPRGNLAYNQRLSMKRAEAVKAFLAEHGVAATKITANGASEIDTGDLANDRRVEVLGKPFGH